MKPEDLLTRFDFDAIEQRKLRADRVDKVYKYLATANRIAHKYQAFADALGKNKSVMSRAINGDPSVLTAGFMKTIDKAFPDTFSLPWLLYGVGEMLVKDTPKQVDMYERVPLSDSPTKFFLEPDRSSSYEEDVERIDSDSERLLEGSLDPLSQGYLPFYGDDSFEGGFSGFDPASEPRVTGYIRYRPFTRKQAFYTTLVGNSMQPIFHSGDILCLRRIEDWTYLTKGRYYGFETTDGIRTLKVLKETSADELVLEALNPLHEVQSERISKDHIRAVFELIGVIDTH